MTNETEICPFCHIAADQIIFENDLAVSIYDKYPVNPGHILVIPRRHVENFFNLSQDEILALVSLMHELKQYCGDEYNPDAYNLGINIGEKAGQTIMHVHVHLIPRYANDVDEPRGGVRNIIQTRGNYPFKDTICNHPS